MKRLIEKDFPFAELSLIAEAESWRKEVYRPVYYIHKWWARRLGSVFRGILLGASLNDSEDFWSHFYGKNSFTQTVVFDPFMGSGVTIGEALKLGYRVVGRDINPVAYFACHASFSNYRLSEVISTYQELERKLSSKLLKYFETETESGEKATVLYYFLVKFIPCPACGKDVDLFSSRIFSKNAVPRKDSSARALCPGCGSINHTTYDAEDVNCPKCSRRYDPQRGNIKGPKVQCDCCLHSFRLVDAMKSLDGPLPFRRYAKLILNGKGQKIYEPFNDFDRQLEHDIAEEFQKIAESFPAGVIEPGYNTNQMLKHNYRRWLDVFSDRHLICIKHLLDEIKNIKDEKLKLLFACLFSGVLEFNNLFTSFKGEGTGAVRHMFYNHVLKPEMMPLEANMWGTPKSSGAFSCLFHSRIERAIAYKSNPTELRIQSGITDKLGGINHPIGCDIVNNFQKFALDANAAYLSAGDSSCVDLPDRSVDLVITDPPFFDNVHYSQLADFFYYWLNQALNYSKESTTRSTKEVQDTDPQQFSRKLLSVFAESNRVLRDDGLFIFTYHHSRHEGWTAVHRAIRHSGFVCIQSYPIKAEMAVSMPLQKATSPINLDLILVCHKDRSLTSESKSDVPLVSALDFTERQIRALRSVGLKVSLGDAKVVLMGQFLCQAHKMRNLDSEERFLDTIEQDIDTYVGQVISSKGEILYRGEEPKQLALFEEMREYLVNKGLQSSTKSAADIIVAVK